jgi:hypothetical protein
MFLLNTIKIQVALSNVKKTVASYFNCVIAFPIWSKTVGALISGGSVIEEKLAMALALLIVSFSITFLI